MATIPLRSKPAGASAPAGTSTTPPPMAGTRTAPAPDDDDDVIPPEPVTPNGDYLARVDRYQEWRDKDTNKVKLDKNGNKRAPSIFLVIDDPAEARKAERGQDSCFGAEVELRMQFVGNFAKDTYKLLAALGAPASSWPKGQEKAGGRPTNRQVGEYVLAVTKGKRFLITAKAEKGTGEYKDQIFCRLKAIKPPPPKSAAPAKQQAKPAAAAPPPEEPAEEQAADDTADDSTGET